MRSISYFLCLCLLGLAHLTWSQTSNLSGIVLDAETRQPLVGASIVIEGTRTGTTTDQSGFFELNSSNFPLTINFSYLGYESQSRRIASLTGDSITVYLRPTSTILEAITITASPEVTPVTDPELYSVVDFILVKNALLTLEYHGSFKAYRITTFDLAGVPRHVTVLEGLPPVEALYASANDNAFLITEKKAYQLKVGEEQVFIEQEDERAVFETYIRTCKAIQGTYAYYIFEQAQGMIRIVKSLNLETQESKRLKLIANEQQIQQCLEDLPAIVRGAIINPIMYDNPNDNRLARNMQEESDFLRRIYYKPEFPVYLYGLDEGAILLNHPERELLFLTKGSVDHQTEIQYLDESNWTSQMLYDKVTKAIYGVFKDARGYWLKRLDPKTGSCQAAYFIDALYLEKVEIHNNVLYYLRKDSPNGSSRAVYLQR